VLLANEKAARSFQVYNVATGDYITVREIADLAVECVGLKAASVHYRFTGGDRGWKGDVPVVRVNTDRVRALGWKCSMLSQEALRQSMRAMIEEVRSATAQA
jgi:UDP-glucose 4-epimerase